MARVALLLLALLVAGSVAFENMNGQYQFANQKPGTQAVHRGTGFFDVYTPWITSVYGQVRWDTYANLPLPEDFVKKYDGKLVNIVGYEFDIVRNGSNGQDESVPAYEQYNHHYNNMLMGKGTRVVETGIPELGHQHQHSMDESQAFGSNYRMVNAGAPRPYSFQFLPMGNGAESRKTFHFFPPGYGALLMSPTTTTIQPMIIDTRNRNTTSRRGGIVPRASNVGPEADYSGLMECPCTTRIVKQVTNYSMANQQTCSAYRTQGVDTIDTAEACVEATRELGLEPIVSSATRSTTTDPAGCSVTAVSGGFAVVFNTNLKSATPCGTKTNRRLVGRDAASLVNLTLNIDGTANEVTIVMEGPSDVWFGVGFGAQVMANKPYTIVALGNGQVEERILADHAPGTALKPSVTVVSNTVAAGRRTVVLKRPTVAPHFKFTLDLVDIPFINAIGTTADFQAHKQAHGSTIFLVETDAPSCICNGSTDQGIIDGVAWGPQRCQPRPLGQMLDDPDWASNGRINPTCLLKSYKGGLRCCKNNNILLDADQPTSEPTQYRLKYRYYYEDGSAATKSTYWTYWWTENNNNEHDIPQCQQRDAKGNCVYKITSNFTAAEMPSVQFTNGSTTLIHVEGHCHIGCQSMELWNMDDASNPKLICKTHVVYGQDMEEPMNEKGYILGNLPCIFGDGDDFEAPPVLLPTTKLMSIKYQNNTVPRYGDMALWEIRAY